MKDMTLKLTNPDFRARRRKKSGDAAEAEASMLLDLCYPLARIRRRTTPQKQTRAGQVIYQGKQGPDFEGILLDRTARHVEIEVKSCARTAWDLNNLDEVQEQILRETWVNGGLAIVMILWSPRGAVAAHAVMLPWHVVQEALVHWRNGGRASIPEDVLEKWIARPMTPPLYRTDVPWARDSWNEIAERAAREDTDPVRRACWQRAVETKKVAT